MSGVPSRTMALAGMIAASMAFGGIATAGASKLITGKQIKNGSITRKDLAKSARAKRGPQGKPGIQGPAGPPGAAAMISRVGYGRVNTGPSGRLEYPMHCAAGEAINGGADVAGAATSYVSHPAIGPTAGVDGDPSGWYLRVEGSAYTDVYPYVICAS